MKWIVGLDLRPSSQGAVGFAAWLSRTAKPDHPQSFIGVHVLEEEHLRIVLRYHHLDEVVTAAKQAADRVLGDAGVAELFGAPQVIEGLRAEDSLDAARVFHHAGAMLLGRQAKREGHELVRLGRVARRMLRKLPCPVIVVPPDLGADDVGGGPILALTKLTPDSLEACRFAAKLAATTSRELVLVHVVPLPEEYGAQYLPPASIDKLRVEHHRTGMEELGAWARDHGLEGAKMRVLQGQMTHHVAELIEELDAALVVVGSRRLTNFERFLLTSHGSELAAVAACPVAVVPPAR